MAADDKDYTETSKNGEEIGVGTHVSTRFRGGHREGDVEAIAVTDEEAKQEDVKNPPKVIFHDQHGHRVAHNPETLEVKEDK